MGKRTFSYCSGALCLLFLVATADAAFNNVNLNPPEQSLASGSFGAISAAGGPRQIQFALKLLF